MLWRDEGSRAKWWLACSALSQMCCPFGRWCSPFFSPSHLCPLLRRPVVRGCGPTTGLLGPLFILFLSCQAISLHSYLKGNTAKGLYAGATRDLTSDTDLAPCHQLASCWPEMAPGPCHLPCSPCHLGAEEGLVGCVEAGSLAPLRSCLRRLGSSCLLSITV